MKKKEKIIFIVALFIIAITLVIILISVISNLNLTKHTEQHPDVDKITLVDFGSAQRLEGKTAIAAIFANDTETNWDFSKAEDIESRKNMFNYIDIATKWFVNEGNKYGKKLSFVYPENENSILYFETEFNEPIENGAKAMYKTVNTEWEYIEKNIDLKKLSETYNYDNIVFFIFTNQLSEDVGHAYAVAYYSWVLDKPYEICYFNNKGNKGTSPSTLAHEALHTFGTPDLYFGMIFENYHVNDDFVAYCAENYKDDIMVSTFVLNEEGEKVRVFDSVPKEITEVTAYYLGWLDYIPDWVDEYKLLHNQFEYYDNLQKVN